MKRIESRDKQVLGVQRPSLERPDSGAAVAKETREELTKVQEELVCKLTGTRSYDVGGRILWQVANAQVWPKPTTEDKFPIKALQLLAEMAPQNATEAMLAVEILAIHDAVMEFLQRATHERCSNEVVDANVQRVTRLGRLNIQLVEAMQNLKGKSKRARPSQEVNVEQVNVHQGGQAIVGSMNNSKEGG